MYKPEDLRPSPFCIFRFLMMGHCLKLKSIIDWMTESILLGINLPKYNYPKTVLPTTVKLKLFKTGFGPFSLTTLKVSDMYTF